MTTCNVEKIVAGIEEAKQGNTRLGLQLLKDSVQVESLPEVKAWFGYCLAKERNDFAYGISLCRESLKKKPGCADSCLALGRIYLLAGRRELAIKTLQKGLSFKHSQEIYRLLHNIGIRKAPIFPFLRRNNMVNIVSGRVLAKVGLR